MIQIEALETIKSDGFDVQAGDRIHLSDDVAGRWCGAGWAKAVNGEIETGERRVIRAVVEPHTAIQNQNAGEVNVDG